MSQFGKIIILNGTSSSGKSTLARALQDTLDEPYLHADSDTFWGMPPDDYFEDVTQAEYEARGNRLVLSCFRAVVALSSSGSNVIFDVVFDMSVFIEKAIEIFGPHKAILVSVYCPLDTLKQREQARGDRQIGLAERQYAYLYDNDVYDLRVNTAQNSHEDCVSQIKTYLQSSQESFAIDRLCHLLTM